MAPPFLVRVAHGGALPRRSVITHSLSDWTKSASAAPCVSITCFATVHPVALGRISFAREWELGIVDFDDNLVLVYRFE